MRGGAHKMHKICFDTTETQLYKYANSIGVPSDYVHADSVQTLTPTYINVDGLLREAYASGVSLSSVVAYLTSIKVVDPRDKASKVLLDYTVKKLNLRGVAITALPQESDAMKTLRGALTQIGGAVKARDLGFYHKMLTEYRQSFEEELDRDEETVARIERVHADYDKSMSGTALRGSDVRVLTEKIELVVTDSTSNEDALAVFDRFILTETVVHVVCYVSAETVYQKISKDVELQDDELVDVHKHRLEKGKEEAPRIVFTVNAEAIYEVIYNLGAKKMTIKVKTNHKELLLESIKQSMPHVQYDVEVIKVDCVTRLYPATETSFSTAFHYLLHRNTIDPEHYQFFLNESTSPYPKKAQLKLRYRPYWKIRGHSYAKEEAYAVVTAPQTSTGTNYFEINTSAKSMESMWRMFTSFIPALVMHYSRDIVGRSDLARLYNNKITVGVPTAVVTKKTSKAKQQLRDEWPTIFSDFYVKNVKPENMVVITTSEDTARSWEQEIVHLKKEQYQRKVLPFPREPAKPIFWFTSYNTTSKHIGYSENSYDTNPEYGEIPYSGKTPQAVLSKKLGVSKGQETLSSPGPGEVYEASEVLGNMLGGNILRVGTIFGLETFLCGMAMVKYNIVGDDPTMESRIREIRQTLSKYNPSLYRQELYDWPESEISKAILEEDYYFDPRLFIAGIRKFLGVSVYVIDSGIESNTEVHKFQIPRYTQFYTAEFPTSGCVVFAANTGIKTDDLEHAHCEIIVASGERQLRERAVFGRDTTERLHSILSSCFMQVPVFGTRKYKDAYIESNLSRSLPRSGHRIVSQFIDGYGKARRFTMSKNGKLTTIFCAPCPPLDVEIDKVVHPTTIKEFEIFCGSQCVGRSERGAWCQDSVSGNVLYARLEDLDMELRYISHDPAPTGESVETSSAQAASDRRLAVVLRELMRWFYEVYCHEVREKNGLITPFSTDSFASRFLTYATPSMLPYYNIEEVTQELPRYLTTQEVLSHISPKVFRLQGGKLLLHNQDYYNSILYFLRRRTTRVISNDYVTKQRFYIQDFYTSLYDFKQEDGVGIISGMSDPKQATQTMIPLLRTLSSSHSEVKHPILYTTEPLSGQRVIFLVQSTQLGKLGSALDVCMKWATCGRNSGYSSDTIRKEVDRDTIVYHIVSGRLSEYAYIKSPVSCEGVYEVVLYNSEDEHASHHRYGALLRV